MPAAKRAIFFFAPLFYALLLASASAAFAQGGPPYYTNDPGTPGNKNWEINFGYMPFFYRGQSISHTPDVDINFGVGDRIQLTYESAWLRVHNPGQNVNWTAVVMLDFLVDEITGKSHFSY